MSLLWSSIRREAMPWEQRDKGMVHTPVPVRDAGFKGLVLPSPEEHEEIYGEKPPYAVPLHEHLRKNWEHHEDDWDAARPEEKPGDIDEHGDPTEEFDERHQKAFEDRVQHKIDHEERPDHHDDALHSFVGEHVDNNHLWNTHGAPKPVDLSKGVYATQTHVSQEHLDRYKRDRSGPTWTKIKYPDDKEYGGGYPAMKHPMFVTHQGRLHAVEGHHRVGAALQRGDSHIMGFHYDADKHGWPARYDPSTEDPE